MAEMLAEMLGDSMAALMEAMMVQRLVALKGVPLVGRKVDQ